MKGSIFRLLEDYLDATEGEGTFDLVLRDSSLAEGAFFVGPGSYPADDLVAVVMAASARLAVEPDELIENFARYSFGALAGMVGPLVDQVDSVVGLLCSLESVIHTEVRKLDPTAHPARFTVSEVGPDELILHYESDLGLFPMVTGLAKGAGDHYGEIVDIEMLTVDGTSASFRVQTTPVPTAATRSVR